MSKVSFNTLIEKKNEEHWTEFQKFRKIRMNRKVANNDIVWYVAHTDLVLCLMVISLKTVPVSTCIQVLMQQLSYSCYSTLLNSRQNHRKSWGYQSSYFLLNFVLDHRILLDHQSVLKVQRYTYVDFKWHTDHLRLWYHIQSFWIIKDCSPDPPNPSEVPPKP